MQENTKSLKKQLAAAIAMLLVAVVALGTATYAWFVSNNKVEAQTTNIKAQANAAFMSIEYGGTAVASEQTLSTEWFDERTDYTLYPADVQKGDADAPKFVTAYGTSLTDGTKKDNYIEVGNAEKAVTDHYAIGAANNYNISSAGVDLTDLVIDKVEVTTGSDRALASAVRVLVVGSNSWQVWGAGEGDAGLKLEKTTGAPLETTIRKDVDTPISVYVYYDGNDSNIYTKNLNALESPVGVTIHFSATQPDTIS